MMDGRIFREGEGAPSTKVVSVFLVQLHLCVVHVSPSPLSATPRPCVTPKLCLIDRDLSWSVADRWSDRQLWFYVCAPRSRWKLITG